MSLNQLNYTFLVTDIISPFFGQQSRSSILECSLKTLFHNADISAAGKKEML